ncbi:hypothetical protein ACET3Z_021692 [Daucus carota]
MNKKDRNGKKTTNAPPMVGGIVEKGFSENTPLSPSSFPRATVLPFPVARHRSHGPHWAPKLSDSIGNLNDEDENEDDDDNGEMMAQFAEPVQRKEKKSVDFSRWRELINDNAGMISKPVQRKEQELMTNAVMSSNKESNKLNAKPKELNGVNEANKIDENVSRHVDFENAVQVEGGVFGNDYKVQDVEMEIADFSKKNVVVEQEEDVSDMNIDDVSTDAHNELFLSEPTNHRNPYKSALDRNDILESVLKPGRVDKYLGFEQEPKTLGSQIDAENRARLQEMSADEIADAQDELKKRLSPSVLENLRRRGQDKSKKQKNSTSGVRIGGQVGNLRGENLNDKSTFPQSETSLNATETDLVMTQADKAMPVNDNSGSPWDAWSKRVESVRELRFSLEGNVIDMSGIKSGYSAGNVSERDLLRTEGDPAAAGYTIKEAIALIRSVVPGQRVLALHLLASVLNRASSCILQNQVGDTWKCSNNRLADWGAIWAFILGPEPELAFSLRMSLDDNHDSVVLAGAKVIQSVLCCDINESFFDISEKTVTYQNGVCTAPVFRSRPRIEDSFLKGGLWKYNTKPSDLLPFDDNTMHHEAEGEKTIQDDIVVAGQDLAAGLVRMGIISRIRYLLETDPSSVLEECVISILIAIARHSPACSDAIINCERLVHTVVKRFTMNDQMEINSFKIKAVKLMKVLAQYEKNCLEFTKNGTFQKMTWHLYRYTSSIDHWVKSGRENCKKSSDLMVEQLRFWKVCIQYGYCVSYLTDLLPSLCIWLDVSTLEKMIASNILDEFTSIANEAYLVLEVLTRRLPNFYSQVESEEIDTDDKETWCWSHVGPIVDLALKWIAFKSDSNLSKCFEWKNASRSDSVVKSQTVKSLLWVISSVMHMLSSLLLRVIPEDTSRLQGGQLPWLPEFVPKIGLHVIKHEFLSFTGMTNKDYGKYSSRCGSFLEYLCYLRHESEPEMLFASVVCLRGSVQVVHSIDKLIRLANMHTTSSQGFTFSSEDKILAAGILNSSSAELEMMMITFMDLIASEWQFMQSIEMFGRGGPAPGVGIGWGASGGGFWSKTVLLAQMDANVVIHLLELLPVVHAKDPPNSEEMRFIMQKINCALNICLIAGPNDRFLLDKLLGYLFQIPVLKCLDLCVREFKEIRWQYEEQDYQLFSDCLTSHFKNRWLSLKKKSGAESKKSRLGHESPKNKKFNLDTIHEDCHTSNINGHGHNSNFLVVEWAHQRLPLPSHWFLSSLSNIIDRSAKLSSVPDSLDCKNNAALLEVAKGGLFFLLGIESVSNFLSSNYHTSVQHVPLSWKLHSLSACLYDGMGVLEDNSRDLFEILQELYGQHLDKSRLLHKGGMDNNLELLRFHSDVHESYSTFIETLTEQFAAVSYGDMIYGRQVTMYLHRSVESPVRLAAWNSLSNARVLELLPPIEKCIAEAEGYLEPAEDNDKILEAYVKSWTSGALDRAVGRGSVAFTLVLHHLASFIFVNPIGDRVTVRNKLVKSLLRDYSGKKQHQSMMMDLIRYSKPSTDQQLGKELPVPQMYEFDKRFDLLKQACEGSISLLSEVDKLRSSFGK